MLRLLLQNSKRPTFYKNASIICRTCSTITDTNNEYVTVYKFPHVRALAVMNRLKLYQTYLAGALIPGSLLASYMDVIKTEGVLIATYMGLTGCIVLYTFSYFFTNFVGFIYWNQKDKLLKFAYIDFWGKRKEMIIDDTDIVPFSDLSPSITDPLYIKVQRYSTKETLKLSLKSGQVLDKSIFNSIFSP